MPFNINFMKNNLVFILEKRCYKYETLAFLFMFTSYLTIVHMFKSLTSIDFLYFASSYFSYYPNCPKL